MVKKQFLFGFGRPGPFLMGCNSGYRAHHGLLAHSVHDTIAVQSYERPHTSFMGCNKFLLSLSCFEAVKAVGCQKENP